jgi:RecQ family ATP-dependent DNA helicase
MRVTSFPAPQESILTELRGCQIQLPENEAEKEVFVLKQLYGFESFKDGQLESIRSISQNNDTLVLIPTGGGKSVVYTVAAVLMQGLSVVVEPLKFIMEEQAEKLRSKQVPAFYYNSSLTDAEMDSIVNTLCRKDLPYAILFTSPECIMSSKLQHVLKTWSDVGKLSFIAVDEAHCIDVWGHGFRPDFLKLGSLKDFAVPIIALTGTATDKVMSSIVSTLAMTTPNVIKVKCARTNLFIQIQAKDNKPLKQVIDFIKTNCPGKRGIVYCARRKDTVDLAHKLKSDNIDAVFVHGGLSDVDRKKYEHAWASGTAHVICATKSFGMGIDQKDVRFVLHLSFPESMEDYVQEIGRAGRDGHAALCGLFFDHKDRSFHLHNIMQIEDKEILSYKYELMNKMAMYCTNRTCRHKFIMSYFNEDIQECEEHCDICTSNVDTIQDCTSIALLVIQGLERLQQVQEKVTVLLLTQFLMGSPTIVLKALALDKAAEFGLVKDYFKTKTGRRDLQALIYHLIITGIISEVPVGTPENPSIVIKTGNVQNLQSGSEKCYFHTTIFN